eukprot:408421_1
MKSTSAIIAVTLLIVWIIVYNTFSHLAHSMPTASVRLPVIDQPHCSHNITRGGLGNQILSYWFGRSLCFWMNIECRIDGPNKEYGKYLNHGIISPHDTKSKFNVSYLLKLCGECDRDVYPWISEHVYCYHNKWFMPLIAHETTAAISTYYDTNQSSLIHLNITQCDIAIHIRCGDSLGRKRRFGGLLTTKFYIESVKYLLSLNNNTCLNLQQKRNIFIITQINTGWSHGRSRITKYFGAFGINITTYLCRKVVFNQRDALASEFGQSYSVQIVNNDLMNDVHLMMRVPYFIASQSTLSLAVSLSRIGSQYYTMISGTTKDGFYYLTNFHSVLPTNQFLAKEVLNVSETNYDQYCITTYVMQENYHFGSPNETTLYLEQLTKAITGF